MVDYDNVKLLFLEILTIFFKNVSGTLFYRPLPPMLGNGKSIDLFKLYLIVRQNGGYERVCENMLWGLVANNCGFHLSYGLAVKLVYVKYLDVLERWMLRIKKMDKNEVQKCDLSDVELDLKQILAKISDKNVNLGGFDGLNGSSSEKFDGKRNLVKFGESTNLGDFDVGLNEGTGKFDGKNGLVKFGENANLGDFESTEKVDGKRNLVKFGENTNLGDFDDLSGSTIEKFDGKRNLVKITNLGDIDENRSVLHGRDDLLTKSSVVEEDCVSRKRKRESCLDLVKWVGEVAKNPCDTAIGILPDRSKWKDYGNEVVWKRVLLLRDEMLLKRDVVDSCAQYSIRQKMHPSMYDDSSGSGRLRCSQRVLSAKDPLKKRRALLFSVSSSSSHSDEDQVDGATDSSAESEICFWWKQRKKRIPVGPQFQADVPEWIEENYETDPKWLGTQIWPLDKRVKKRTLIDRNPIGKGRKDICGCQSPGSYDCVKLHIFEKRRKVKIDLGSAYYQWKFDSMGEEVALSWSREEERKFQDIVKSNPLSEEKSFWKEIFKFFPNKSRESLVSYYFNVFLLRRRSEQNRTNASNVDSDDDESEYGPRFNCFGRDAKFSIFRSPKKSMSGSEVVHNS
ncbi:AT-rich interactive domain-containing protein 2-like [Lycium barbarum]|uniref:AT-rich interactive domain-containing protein 2-like n=1 Tax=Lycium barbarum TaxID=112863 RepID=UPI00293E2FEF|nr:AT-rich interactive domain-containing protein 2-like [Lycium barbarum]